MNTQNLIFSPSCSKQHFCQQEDVSVSVSQSKNRCEKLDFARESLRWLIGAPDYSPPAPLYLYSNHATDRQGFSCPVTSLLRKYCHVFPKFLVSGKCINSHCELDAIWPTPNTNQKSAFSDQTFLFLSVPLLSSQMDCSVSVSAPSRTRSSTRSRSQCWRGCRKSWNSWCCRVTLIFPFGHTSIFRLWVLGWLF